MTLPQITLKALPWLADLAVLSTLWLGMLWLLPRCIRSLSAAKRHLLLVAGLACLPVLMVGALRTPTWKLPVIVRVVEPAAFPDLPDAQSDSGLAGDPFEAGGFIKQRALGIQGSVSSAATTWQDVVLLLWLAGLFAGVSAMTLAAWHLRRLKSAAVEVRDRRLLNCFQRACSDAGVSFEKVSLLEHAGAITPMTWGLRRPLVLLPASARQWPEARIMMVLRHELAHVARMDVQVALGTALTLLPLWFHPLAWLVWREAHDAREAACDDAAFASSGESAGDFATRLLEAVTASGTRPHNGWRVQPMALCMASRGASALRRRLAFVLDEKRDRHPWSRWQRRGILLSLMGIAAVVSGLSACRDTTLSAPAGKDTVQVVLMSKVLSVRADSQAGRTLAAAFDPPGTASGLQLRGILDEADAQQLLAKLDQAKDDVRVLSTPTVTTRSGQMASVEVIREFIYPSEFDPPSQEKGQPFTPSTPTAFEMRPVGVRMQLEPTVGDDGVIDLRAAPEVTQFLGLVDYGAPVRSEIRGDDGKLRETLVSENKIQQPIFHTMKCQTSVSVREGQYLIIGGLADEQDKLEPGPPDTGKVAALSKEVEAGRLVYFLIQSRIKR